MNTIIITGSNGFIGSNLVDKLSKTHKLILILRIKSNSKKTIYKFEKNISVKFFKNNKELKNILKKTRGSWLIHCATHYIKKHKFDDISKVISSNIEFGTILLDNLNKMGVKNFINFSTIWENYNGIKDNAFNLYSASKQAFEKIINYYQSLNKTIISKNLYINLLNVSDITLGIYVLLKNKIKSGKYSMINKKTFQTKDLLQGLQKRSKYQIKVKWLSSKIIKEKIYNYKSLPGWKSINSNINDLIKFILEDYKV